VTFDGLVTRHGRYERDPERVIVRLFVPGQQLAGTQGQASGVVERVLALSDCEVTEALGSVMARFEHRHRDLADTFRHHAGRIGNRLDSSTELSEERTLLLGATFTHEYSVEAAALCNPSAVPHPDQSGVPSGSLRIVMSVRQIGEGHRSSIGFRSGLVDANGDVTIDAPGRFTTAGTVSASVLDADSFRGLAQRRRDTNAISWVLDGLPAQFTMVELEARLAQLDRQHDTRRDLSETIHHLRELATRTYTTSFPSSSELGERVIYPSTDVESNGIEDARFVRFVDGDDATSYHATCTAFDGRNIVQQLLTTDDFVTFAASPLLGEAATNKGMALFPRRIKGRFAALSRHDGATNAIAFSDDMRQWPTATSFPAPTAAWEAIQVGNCGSPIETAEGWLVLTHGVGPMRSYSLGAWLLDLEDPTTIIGKLPAPLLTPQPDEQDGYVPNVVYSCGALLHGAHLVIPFGIGDQSISVATVAVDDVLEAMRVEPRN
jgi:predicted GH43/DUF377 family glycosyl hydrolase